MHQIVLSESQDQIRLVIGQMFPTETLEWFVGDYCRAVCDYDGLERECQIVQQNETDVGLCCTVHRCFYDTRDYRNWIKSQTHNS